MNDAKVSLYPRLGPGRVSHPKEYANIIRDLEGAGVDIDYRVGNLAYSPAKGGPGRMILDPDASIGALRHEFQHFKDVQMAGYPGLAHYYRNLAEFARVEARGYLQEVAIARQTGNADLVPKIIAQMKRRVKELTGR